MSEQEELEAIIHSLRKGMEDIEKTRGMLSPRILELEAENAILRHLPKCVTCGMPAPSLQDDQPVCNQHVHNPPLHNWERIAENERLRVAFERWEASAQQAGLYEPNAAALRAALEG